MKNPFVSTCNNSNTDNVYYETAAEGLSYRSKGGYFLLRLALGHHDNLTKEKEQSVPKLRTSNVSWFLYGEGGIFYKNVYISIFGTPLMFPIPSTSFKNGYVHGDGSFNMGVKTHAYLLPKKSKFNLLPTFGYARFKERAHIYDPNGNNPDLLDVTFKDDAPIYGLSFQFSIDKDQGLIILDYLREAHRIGANKYRIQVGGFFSGEERTSVIRGFTSLALEYVAWNDKRRDWFIVFSVSIEESDVKGSK